MTAIVSHSPDTPFGCATTWGATVAGWGEDFKIHVCNAEDCEHDGSHVCKCGDTLGVPVIDGQADG